MKKFLTAAMLLIVTPLFAVSYYPARLDDKKAVYLTADSFPVKGDGVAGGSDHRELFVLARSSLYTVKLSQKGR